MTDGIIPVEERLKDLIVKKYGSVKAFTSAIDIPNSSFANILARGIMNANVLTVITVCKALNISPEELSDGRIVEAAYVLDEPTDILIIYENFRQALYNGHYLTIGELPATTADVNWLVDAFDTVLQVWKQKTDQEERLKVFRENRKKNGGKSYV